MSRNIYDNYAVVSESDVGAFVGVGNGEGVSAFVGSGAVVGVGDGGLSAPFVGSATGVGVGVWTDSCVVGVGPSEGWPVGVADGWPDGVTDGDTDGVTEGEARGSSVGEGVGDAKNSLEPPALGGYNAPLNLWYLSLICASVHMNQMPG